MNTEAAIISMIMSQAVALGFNPNLAASVAKTESNFNPKAIGAVGEVGLFQIRPEYFPNYTKKQLMDPKVNTQLGIKKLLESQKYCKHKEDFSWVVCFNAGITGGSKIKYPKLFPYYKKIKKNYDLPKL